MTTDRVSPEQDLLRVVRKVLASVVKDVTPQDGLENPLSARTIEEIREIFGLISLRERELLLSRGGDTAQRPRYSGERRSAKVVPIDSAGLSASRRKAAANPLADTALFRGVDMDAVEGLLDDCPLYELQAGEALLEAGDTADELYLVLAGRLHAAIGERATAFVAGQTLGEISALGESTMSADVVAAEDSLVLAIDPERLWAMMDQDAVLARNILVLLAQR